jgi:hypothetical protein
MTNLLEEFSRDLRHSARMLLKWRAFTSIAVIKLALGIGANTAIFSLVRGLLLRPLPFSESERLTGIRESKVGEGHNNPMAFRTYAEIRDKAQTIESIAAYVNWRSHGAFGLNRTTVSAFNAPSVISTVSPGESFSLTKVKCIGVPELVPCRSCGDESQQYLFSSDEISFACNLIWQA